MQDAGRDLLVQKFQGQMEAAKRRLGELDVEINALAERLEQRQVERIKARAIYTNLSRTLTEWEVELRESEEGGGNGGEGGGGADPALENEE